MPKVSMTSASQGGDHGPVVERSENLDGYAVNFLTFLENIDHTPLLKGLPGDQCPCPHWGYVFKGALTFRCGDREETFHAGDAFYLPPGHVPIRNEPGTEYLQFSPQEQLEPVSETIMKNMQAMQGGS